MTEPDGPERKNGAAGGDGTDAALLRACRDGNQGAWNSLVERYGRMVYSIPRRLGLSPEDADDVFQTVFSTLLKRLDQIEDPGSLPYWLMTTTRRESWRVGKQHGRFTDLDESVLDESEPVGSAVEQYERDLTVRAAMERLDPRCRQLLTALFLDSSEQSYQAIAAEFGMPVGSIGPTRARCLRKVQGILKDLGLERI
ncbi:MAG: RNA polymerase sigma factor [Chloroflexota bacterium]